MATTENCDSCPEDDSDCAEKKYLMVEVEEQDAATDPCATSTVKECPVPDSYTFDKSTGEFVVPAAGAYASFPVCKPERYTVCQWVFIKGAGHFQIYSVESDSLNILNACDGTLGDTAQVVPTNASPGTVIASGATFFVSDSPGACPDETFCDTVKECLANATDICFSSVPDLTGDGHLFAGSGQVCPDPEEEVPSCLRKVPNIFIREDTICFGNVSESNGETVGASDLPVQLAVLEPDGSGKMCLKALTAIENGFFGYCNGNLVKIFDNLGDVGDGDYFIKKEGCNITFSDKGSGQQAQFYDTSSFGVSGSATAIPFASEVAITQSFVTENNGVFTISEAGQYMVMFNSGVFDSAGSASSIFAQLYVEGVLWGAEAGAYAAVASAAPMIGLSGNFTAVAGSTFQIKGYAATSGSAFIGSRNLSVVRIA
jgi:hypothetical protein